MSIPITGIVQRTDKSWVFTWDDLSAAFYRVVLWGTELAQTSTLQYTWNGQEYKEFPPPLEIAYEDEKVLSEEFLPYLVIQWYRDEGAVSYEVQKRKDTTWTKVKTIQNSGEWVYTYRSVILEDRQLYEYRVVATDELGNQSTPRAYERFVVTPPAPVDGLVQVSYSGGNVVISQS